MKRTWLIVSATRLLMLAFLFGFGAASFHVMTARDATLEDWVLDVVVILSFLYAFPLLLVVSTAGKFGHEMFGIYPVNLVATFRENLREIFEKDSASLDGNSSSR